MLGVVELAEIVAGGVGVDDPSGLLERAVGVDQLAAHRARSGFGHGLHQGREPAGLDLGVVVQKDDVFAFHAGEGAIVAAHEPEVLLVADDLDVGVACGELGEHVGRGVAGGVVHDDKLEMALVRVGIECPKALFCIRYLVVAQDDYADLVRHGHLTFAGGRWVAPQPEARRH